MNSLVPLCNDRGFFFASEKKGSPPAHSAIPTAPAAGPAGDALPTAHLLRDIISRLMQHLPAQISEPPTTSHAGMLKQGKTRGTPGYPSLQRSLQIYLSFANSKKCFGFEVFSFFFFFSAVVHELKPSGDAAPGSPSSGHT